jgi:hypothetical protein
MTLKELAGHPVLENGTKVSVKIGKDAFLGKIVGQGSPCPNPIYLVECTDGYIPSETYQYKTCVIPLSEMSLL